MKISSPPSSYHHHSFHDRNQLLENKKKQECSRFHKCNFCGKKFSSGNALGGHKASHHRLRLLPPKKRITKALALSLNQSSNNHDVLEMPAIDLARYLPPKNYNTKKVCRRGINKYRAAQILVHMLHSCEAYNRSLVDLDVDRRREKRLKLSANVDELDKILQSPELGADRKEKIDEGEKGSGSTRDQLGSTSYVRDFDLNELPNDDVADDTI